MVDAFKKGLDLHSRTAIEVFGEVKKYVAGRTLTRELLEEIAKEFKPLRSKAKNTNFMVLYGGGEQRYAEMNNATKYEGRQVIELFNRTYVGIARDIEKTRRLCRQTGYVRTLLGRYVHIPEIASSDFGKRGHAERECYNAKIQGSAGDMLRMSMLLIHCDEKLRELPVVLFGGITQVATYSY
jgi:DNA polymerase-1